jgi:hypothetical protein
VHLSCAASVHSLIVKGFRLQEGERVRCPPANLPLYAQPIFTATWTPPPYPLPPAPLPPPPLPPKRIQVCCWDLALERDPEEEAALAPEGNALLQVCVCVCVCVRVCVDGGIMFV